VELYVRTRGDGLHQGYRWIQVAGQDIPPPRASVPLIAQQPEASNLVYTEDFSVILLHTANNLTLQITGLAVTEHSRRQRRNVQNILVCVGTPRDERILRGIVVAALTGTLPAIVDTHICAVADEPGFQVDGDGLLHALSSLQASDTQIPERRAWIDQDTDEMRQQLIEELDTCMLPARMTYLVVVTRYRMPEVLHHAGVWRGLTSLPVNTNRHVISSNRKPFFPAIQERNRAGEVMHLPSEFETALNIVILGKHLQHRKQGQEWLDRLDFMLVQHKVQFYILLLSASLVESTIKGLLTHVSIARQVIFVQYNQQRILSALHMQNADTLRLFLVNRSGQIFWEGQGECDQTQIRQLQAVLAAQTNELWKEKRAGRK